MSSPVLVEGVYYKTLQNALGLPIQERKMWVRVKEAERSAGLIYTFSAAPLQSITVMSTVIDCKCRRENNAGFCAYRTHCSEIYVYGSCTSCQARYALQENFEIQ